MPFITDFDVTYGSALAPAVSAVVYCHDDLTPSFICLTTFPLP